MFSCTSSYLSPNVRLLRSLELVKILGGNSNISYAQLHSTLLHSTFLIRGHDQSSLRFNTCVFSCIN